MSSNTGDNIPGSVFVGGSTMGTSYPAAIDIADDDGLSIPPFTIATGTTTWTDSYKSKARLPKKLRETLTRLRMHLDTIEQYAPDGVLLGDNDSEAAGIIAEELADAFEVLQAWMADHMRDEVKEA